MDIVGTPCSITLLIQNDAQDSVFCCLVTENERPGEVYLQRFGAATVDLSATPAVCAPRPVAAVAIVTDTDEQQEKDRDGK